MARTKVTELTDTQRLRFDKCWNVYPRKVNKGEAEIAWAQIDPDDELTEKIFDSILLQNKERGTKFISKEDKKFIKHFASWLRAKGWVFESETSGELSEQKRDKTKCRCGGDVYWRQKENGVELCIKCYDKYLHGDDKRRIYDHLCSLGLGKLKDETKQEWVARLRQNARQAFKRIGTIESRNLAISPNPHPIRSEGHDLREDDRAYVRGTDGA